MNIIGTLIGLIKILIILSFILVIIGMVACMVLFAFYTGVFIAGSLGLEGVYKYACITGAILMLTFPYVIKILLTLASKMIFVPGDEDEENDDEDEHDVAYEYDEYRYERNKKRRK
jgi:uncharacterized membrane protein